MSLHFEKKQTLRGYSRQIKVQTPLPFSAKKVTTVPFSFGQCQCLERQGTNRAKGEQGFFLEKGGKNWVGKRHRVVTEQGRTAQSDLST